MQINLTLFQQYNINNTLNIDPKIVKTERKLS